MEVLQQYKCPNCDGAIELDIAYQNGITHKLKCRYCGTRFELETLQAYEQELQQDTPDDMTWDTAAGGDWTEGEAEGIRSYVCQNCAGEILADENTGATSCPYCGSPVVMMNQFAGALKPDLVIPFKLDKEAAKEALKNHLKGKPLLPKSFKSENRLEELKGIYVPFWLFDADADADIRYKATRVSVWSDSKYNYTKTSYYSIHRAGSLGFNGVPVDGSKKMDDTLMESLEPFDLTQAVDFQTAYLAGYLADQYDVSSETCMPRANQRIKTSTENAFRDTVSGYNTVTTQASSIQLKNSKVSYALLPVWILNTKYKDKDLMFAMNGQTGKFVGNLPVNWGAFWGWLLGIAGAVTALAFGISCLF